MVQVQHQITGLSEEAQSQDSKQNSNSMGQVLLEPKEKVNSDEPPEASAVRYAHLLETKGSSHFEF